MHLAGRHHVYTSPNGDRWEAVRFRGKLVIGYWPNKASGGKPSVMDIGMFLATNRLGPEHEALMALLRDGCEDVQYEGTNAEEPRSPS